MEGDESYLEYILSDAIVWELMDVYDELQAGQFHDALTWANEALEEHSYIVEAEFDPQLWVI